MTDKASSLTDSVPRIVITEPSPMPVTNSGLIQNIIRASADNESTSVAEPSTAIATADLVPEPKFPVTVTADENVTSDSELSCSVSVEDKVQEVVMEVEDGGELLTPPTNEVAEDDVTDVGGVYASCCRRFDKFRLSRFMIAILSVLLTMPIASLMMGVRYMDKCPLSGETPLFLFMMGVTGTLVILCRIAYIIRKTSPNLHCFDLYVLKSIIVFGCLAIILLLCTEITSFLRMSPNFEPGAPNYCHRNFYNFTYWLNWTSLFVIAFLSILHVPDCRRQNGSPNQS